MKRFFFFLFACCLVVCCFPQNVLYVEKNGTLYKNLKFENGDVITFKLDGENYWVRAKIDSIGEKFIMINSELTPISINRIDAIRIRNDKSRRIEMFKILAYNSILLTGISALTSWAQGYSIDWTFFAVVGAELIVPFIVYVIPRRQSLTLNGKNKLKTITT